MVKLHSFAVKIRKRLATSTRGGEDFYKEERKTSKTCILHRLSQTVNSYLLHRRRHSAVHRSGPQPLLSKARLWTLVRIRTALTHTLANCQYGMGDRKE